MIDLQKFVSEAIVEIVKGVVDAKAACAPLGANVNPSPGIGNIGSELQASAIWSGDKVS